MENKKKQKKAEKWEKEQETQIKIEDFLEEVNFQLIYVCAFVYVRTCTSVYIHVYFSMKVKYVPSKARVKERGKHLVLLLTLHHTQTKVSLLFPCWVPPG